MTVSLDHQLETETEIRLFLVEAAISLAFARLAETAFTGVRLSAASIDRLEGEARKCIATVPRELVAHGAEALLEPAIDRAGEDVHAFFDVLRAMRTGIQ